MAQAATGAADDGGSGGGVGGGGTAATLLQALQALYHHPDPEVRSAANRWLEDFQQTVEAWQVSDSLLHSPTSSLEVQYFCAQTLRTKIQRDFEELPPGAPVSLRDSLLALLFKFLYLGGPAAVRTQLCLAIAAVAAHLPQDKWGPSGGIVTWLGDQLSSNLEAYAGLLEILTVLPQEASSYKIAIRPERRRQFISELVAAVPEALNLLAASLLKGSGGAKEQVLLAFAAWLRISNGNVSASVLASHPLTISALDGLARPETFDAAVEAVCELIRFSVGSSSADIAANMPLIQILVPRVMALRPRFNKALKAAQEEKQGRSGVGDTSLDGGGDEDDDTVKGMARLFAEMGEAYVDLIASGSSEALLVAEVLIEVTSHPDDSIAATTFNFWHHLSRCLSKRHDDHADEAVAATAERNRRLALFRPLFEVLVQLVSFRVQYPKGYDEWRRDEKADFKHTRCGVADILVDAAAVLGGEHSLQLLARPLVELTQGTSAGALEWPSAEAPIYCIRAIANVVPRAERSVLPQVMELLPQLPRQPQLLYTVSLMIAAYSDWLAGAAQQPSHSNLLPSVLALLTESLSAPDDAPPAAALALKHVCDACRQQLVVSIDPLIQIYHQVLAANPMVSTHTATNQAVHLAAADELQIVEGISMVVSALPADRASGALHAICFPISSALQQAVLAAQQQAMPVEQSSSISGQFSVSIDRIANIFRYVTQPSLVVEAFQQMWPLLQPVFALKGSDDRVMERLCRACKYAIRNAGRTIGPFLGTIMEEIERNFRQPPHQPCLLYVASEAVKVFGSDGSCSSPLSFLLASLFGECTRILKTTEDFTQHPDLVDDCFLLASRCIRYCPHLVYNTSYFGQLLDCSMRGITLQHREACRSLLNFLRDALELPLKDGSGGFRDFAEAELAIRGGSLARLLLAALTGALPESRTVELVDVVAALARLCSQSAVQWFNQAAALLPSAAASEEEKTKMLMAVAATASGAREPSLLDTLEELSDSCRRNRRIRDMAQAALRPTELVLT
eukprot:SM000002S05606  [mRNA]  locus=s2:1152982:1161233:- [translate_table: standard]